MIGAYTIENMLNGHLYVGSSADIDLRWDKHRRLLQRGTHHNCHLQSAWNQYGEHAFVFALLEEYDSDCLLSAEQWWINMLRPEYNIAQTAGAPMRGRHLSEAARAKISASGRGLKRTATTRARISVATMGHKRNLGRKHTTEELAKMSAALMGNQNGLGHKHSETSRAKISAGRKGKGKGRPWTQAQRLAHAK